MCINTEFTQVLQLNCGYVRRISLFLENTHKHIYGQNIYTQIQRETESMHECTMIKPEG